MYRKIKIATAALVLSSVAALYPAAVLAELVYDAPVKGTAAAEIQTRTEDERETSRSVMKSSEKAKTSVDASRSASIEMPESTVVAPVAAATEVQNVSKSELLRRERVREEIKNEDLLQERIEELRLRDEQKRTEKIIKTSDSEKAPEAVAPPAPIVVAPQTQSVVVPVIEAPAVRRTDKVVSVQSAAVSSEEMEGTSIAKKEVIVVNPDAVRIGVTPRAGVSSMASANGYNLSARFSIGVALDVSMSEYVALELGYQYSTYGLKFAPGNGFVEQMRATYPTFYNDAALNRDTHVLKQNVFDMGVRLYLLGRNSIIRPFLGAGGGYGNSYLNYENRYIDAARAYGRPDLARDYQIQQFLGYLSAGVDIEVSRSVRVSALFKYYNILSSQEDGQLNNAALAYPAAYGMPPQAAVVGDPAKQYLGGSLANSSFYSILAGLTFEF